jgi:hypothetical protein
MKKAVKEKKEKACCGGTLHCECTSIKLDDEAIARTKKLFADMTDGELNIFVSFALKELVKRKVLAGKTGGAECKKTTKKNQSKKSKK